MSVWYLNSSILGIAHIIRELMVKLDLPKSYLVLLHRFNEEKNSVQVFVFDKSKGVTRASPVHIGRLSFLYENKLFRPYRYEERAGNTYRFLKSDQAIEMLENADLIFLMPHDKPSNLSDYLSYFNKKDIPSPKVMPVCITCIREHRRLTRLKKKTSYQMYNKTVCRHCASEEIKDEYKRRGIPLTPSARKYYTKLLTRFHSVQDVIANLWRPIEISKDPEKTLFDVIPADEDGGGIPLHRFLEESGKTQLLDRELVNHFNRIGMGNLLPVQRLAINEGLLEKRDLQEHHQERHLSVNLRAYRTGNLIIRNSSLQLH